MAKDPVNNLNVLSQDLLPTPQEVKQALPLTDKAQATVLQGREAARRILISPTVWRFLLANVFQTN